MDVDASSTFGDLLRRCRLARGLTQEELATCARLSVRGISDLERGLKLHPHRETVDLLANALGRSAEQQLRCEAARGRRALRRDRLDPFRVGLDHLAPGIGQVADLARLKEQLDRSDVPNHGIEDDPVLGAKDISFYDPDGIGWELYAASS